MNGKRCESYPSIRPSMDPRYCYQHQPSKPVVMKPSPPKLPAPSFKQPPPPKLPAPSFKQPFLPKLPTPPFKQPSPPRLPAPSLRRQSPLKVPTTIFKPPAPPKLPSPIHSKMIIAPKVGIATNLKLNKIPIDTHVYAMDKFTMEPPKISPHGTYGEVLFGTITATGDRIVLKKYMEPLTDIVSFQSKLKELLLLQHLNQYPETKVVKFYGVCIQRDILYLVLQRLDKDLHNISVAYSGDNSKNQGRLPPDMYKVIFYKILQAFYAIHSLGVVHNDIKLGNIMLFGNDIRIIDFGISDFIGLGPTKELANRYMCTQHTKAPDDSSMPYYLPTNRKTYASDLFSIGATMIHLIIREYRYINVDPVQKIIRGELVQRGRPEPSDDITGYLTTKLTDVGIDLLVKIMHPDVHKRWCCKQALNHPYFTNIATLLPVGINRTIVGGGNIITNKRLFDDVTLYTSQEFDTKSMELCYLEEIYQNYMDNVIPVLKIDQKDIYNQITLRILNNWNGETIFNSFDSVINGQLLMKRTIDDAIKRRGVDNFTGMSMLIHNLYDSILSFYSSQYDEYTAEYMFFVGKSITPNELHRLMIDEFIVHNDAKYEFLPVWCIVMYVFLKLKYESFNPRITALGDNLLTLIGKWVLFFFIQDTPYDTPLTTVDLVRFCAIFVLSRHLGIPTEILNNAPIVEWLSIPPNICDTLYGYYTNRLFNITTLRKRFGKRQIIALRDMFIVD